MTSTLERLAELVRQAEARARAKRLGGEVRLAGDVLSAAQARAEAAQVRVREERPICLRDLKEAGDEAKLLHEMTIKLAQCKTFVSPDDEAERLIQQARAEIEAKRIAAQKALDAIVAEAAEAQKSLQAALARYQELRRELDRLLPHEAAQFEETDRKVPGIIRLVPSGQIPELIAEIDDGTTHFGFLDAREQKAQLMIWIGRLRRLQELNFAESGEEVAAMELVFRRLVGLSKQYMPGYIDAFQEGYAADWEQYIVDAQELFRLAAESARRDREAKAQREEAAQREEERKRVARESYREAFVSLRATILAHDLPRTGVEEFLAILARVVSLGGASEPELLELVRPYRELIGGGDFRALRKHLDRIRGDETKVEEEAALRARHGELIAQTRDRRALIIGGAAREEARKSLLLFFEFKELEWEPYESSRPALLRSLEQRVRNQGVDLILILKEFVSHAVPERLRPLCEESGIACVMVEHGYGAHQIAEALRPLGRPG
ncbi:hypothetical protein TA3x_002910 [Tundrisphaera sp. TA3]|uniref:hypothetical protein n=1 Tax=Tundrisphaera sp. TA3 TaxID=3435775 RepID=UPI003EBE0748